MDRRQVLMLFVIGIGIALNVHLVGAIDDNVTSNRNPKHYNIGAILSDNQYIVSFINEIDESNTFLSEAMLLHPLAFKMTGNPIHTAQDVCDKLISSEVYAVIVSHSEVEKQSPTSVSFTCGFYNIPVIGISNRDSSLSNKNLHSSFMRTIPPYSHQADVWIEMLLSLEYTNVIFIHSSDNDGLTTLNRFQNLADKWHIRIESIIEYEPGVYNIQEKLLFARDNHYCRVFILYANTVDAERIFADVRGLQMDQSDYVWIVSEQAFSAANRFNGLLSLKLKKSDETLMIKDSVSILAKALREMYHHEVITSPPTNCRYTSTNKWQTGLLFYKYLRKQTYNGQSGRIEFDDLGDRLFSEYELLNVHSNNTEVIVGKYIFGPIENKMKLSLHNNLIRWPGNEQNKPLGYYVPKHLKVSTLPEEPFIWAKPTDALGKCQAEQIPCPKFNLTTGVKAHYCCEGYCIDLLKELSKKLNFTYELSLVSDGQYGNFEYTEDSPYKRWTGLVGELYYKRSDMAVAPLTANPERSQAIAFSKPFKYEGITILQKRQPRKATLASFLQPFQNSLWILVLVSVHVVALALYLLDRFSPFGSYKIDEYSSPQEESLNLSGAIWFSWGVLLNSGIGEKTPRSFSSRVLGIVWAGFAMIVVASYTANLAAFLVLNPRDDHALSGIEDSRLRNPTESFTFATVKGSAVDMFFRSQVHLFNAYRTMEETNRNTPEEALEALKKGELDAFIWDSPRLEYEAAQDCELVIAGELFGRSGYGIGLQKDSYWTSEVTLALLRMHESGFMETLDNKWILAHANNCDGKLDNFPYTLGMKNMAGVFILVFSGIIASFGLIVIEIIYKKRKARKIQRLSMARRMAIRWILKTKENRARYNLSPPGRFRMPACSSKQVMFGQPQKEPDLIDYGLSIPPPPPPPQRIASPPYMYNPLTMPNQRTAQQKIYEYKHRKPFGYY